MAQLSTTADHDRFDEAAQYFLTRVVLTEREALALGADAGRRAFWIGGGLQLAQIQRVFDSIGKAQVSGEPFEEWRERVRGELTDDAHAETVFRNAVQRSYSAGRYAQMREPSVAKFRPYVMFDAVLDSRTTTICKTCHGTILPLEHEFWATHTPPLHHRCRAGTRSLRREQAEKRGITNVPPALDPPDGFGLAPGADPVWKPDPNKHDGVLLNELGRKEATSPPPKPKPKAAPKEHDPKHWEREYEKRYGEAAPAIGWGRAMLERGLDRSPSDVLGELNRLKAAGHPGLQLEFFDWLEQLEPNRPLRLQVAALEAGNKVLIGTQEHARTIKTAAFPVDTMLPAVKSAKAFYELMLDASVRRVGDWKIELWAGARAFATAHPGTMLYRGQQRAYSARSVVLGSAEKVSTAVHELAHAIEYSDDRALKRSRTFLLVRAKEGPVGLRDLNRLRPLDGYEDGEAAWPDKFIHPYIGKEYGPFSTEVTSMGYEALALPRSAELGWANLGKKDEEMLWFLLGQLAGR